MQHFKIITQKIKHSIFRKQHKGFFSAHSFGLFVIFYTEHFKEQYLRAVTL